MAISFKGTGTIQIKRAPGSTFITKMLGVIVNPISPQDLSNLVIWTPIESASLNQGTFQEPTDGGNICGWFAQASSSEVGWNRIRQTQAFCPAWVATSSDFNNLSAIHFDSASNEQLDVFVDSFPSDLSILHNGTSWTMMLVLMISGTNPDPPILTIFDNLDDNNNLRRGVNLRYRDDGSNNDRLIFNLKNGSAAVVTGSTNNGEFTAGSPHILTIRHTSGSELKIFVDGAQAGGDGNFTGNAYNTSQNTTDEFQFGLNTIGAPLGRPANMFWTEFVMYSGSKSDGDQQGVEKFFSNKYNIGVPF